MAQAVAKDPQQPLTKALVVGFIAAGYEYQSCNFSLVYAVFAFLLEVATLYSPSQKQRQKGKVLQTSTTLT